MARSICVIPVLRLVAAVIILQSSASFAFVQQPQGKAVSFSNTVTKQFVFGNKKNSDEDYDFSDIETRDMTREEMLALNAENEKVMNQELQMMTGFSLVISLPILYLCWVAFFSD